MIKHEQSVHVSYIEEGTIKREYVNDTMKPKTIVRASMTKDNRKQEQCSDDDQSSSPADSPMKVELLRKLQQQREKIQEESKRCIEAKEAWVKRLEESTQARKQKDR